MLIAEVGRETGPRRRVGRPFGHVGRGEIVEN
jgi:hypothetical protein